MGKRIGLCVLCIAMIFGLTGCTSISKILEYPKGIIKTIGKIGSYTLTSYTTEDGKTANKMIVDATRCLARNSRWEDGCDEDWYSYIPKFLNTIDIVQEKTNIAIYYWKSGG